LVQALASNERRILHTIFTPSSLHLRPNIRARSVCSTAMTLFLLTTVCWMSCSIGGVAMHSVATTRSFGPVSNTSRTGATSAPPLCTDSCINGEYCSATDTCTLPQCTGRLDQGQPATGWTAWNYNCELPPGWTYANPDCQFPVGYDSWYTNGALTRSDTACARVCETNFYDTTGFRGASQGTSDNCNCLFDGGTFQSGTVADANWVSPRWTLYVYNQWDPNRAAASGPLPESDAQCGFSAHRKMAYEATTSASATGDPHLQNIHGERFDLMKPGKVVLIKVPRGQPVEKALLTVEADARRLGLQCADIYFQSLNVTGAWADKVRAGGLTFTAGGARDETLQIPGWTRFGPLQLKVVHGRTSQGTEYLNFYVKHLRDAGAAVGGLLGEDDYTEAARPEEGCEKLMSLKKRVISNSDVGHTEAIASLA